MYVVICYDLYDSITNLALSYGLWKKLLDSIWYARIY